MKRLMGIILAVALTFSAGLFFNEYKTVDRWQKKAIRIQNEQVMNDRSLNKVSTPCPTWLEQSPLIIALGLWIGLLSNAVTLLMSFLSAFLMFLTYRRERVKI